MLRQMPLLHPLIDYFPVTQHPQLCYSLITLILDLDFGLCFNMRVTECVIEYTLIILHNYYTIKSLDSCYVINVIRVESVL